MNEYSGQFGLAFIFQSTYEFIDFLDKMNKFNFVGTFLQTKTY